MSIVIFVVVFVLTILLQQWLHRHIQGLGLVLTGNAGCAVRLLFYLLLPGVLLHEGSHYVIAKLLFVRTHGFQVGVGKARKKQISLGSVNVERSDPVRESLIGVAPFAVGVAAIWMLLAAAFELYPNSGLSIEQMVRTIAAYSHDWTTWVVFYLIFAVSTAMIPSESDREPWFPVITLFGLFVALLLLLGWTPRIPQDTVILARQLLDALTFALAIAVVVNGAIAIVLWVLERTVERVSGKRVEYRVRRK